MASEELARDNCAVSDEVVQLREDKASQSQNLEALQVRLTVGLARFRAEICCRPPYTFLFYATAHGIWLTHWLFGFALCTDDGVSKFTQLTAPRASFYLQPCFKMGPLHAMLHTKACLLANACMVTCITYSDMRHSLYVCSYVCMVGLEFQKHTLLDPSVNVLLCRTQWQV